MIPLKKSSLLFFAYIYLSVNTVIANTVAWNGNIIDIAIPVGSSHIIHYPIDIKEIYYDSVSTATAFIEVQQIAPKQVLINSLIAHKPIKIISQSKDSAFVHQISSLPNYDNKHSKYTKIVIGKQSVTNTLTKKADPKVTLLQYAAQSLFAPVRLKPNIEGVYTISYNYNISDKLYAKKLFAIGTV